MPVNNVDYLGTLALSAFKDLSLIVTTGGFLLWVRATLPNKDAVKRGCLVLLALLINFALAGRAVRGVQTSRYVAPLLVAFLLYLISTARLPIGLLRTRSLAGAWVLTVVLLAAAGVFAYRYGSLLADQVHEKLAIRRQALFPSARELREYQHLQQAVPVGATILCSLMRNYLLDVKRNRILVHDLPADFGPAPGWPREYGGPSMCFYLRATALNTWLSRPLHSQPQERLPTLLVPSSPKIGGSRKLSRNNPSQARLFTKAKSGGCTGCLVNEKSGATMKNARALPPVSRRDSASWRWRRDVQKLTSLPLFFR